MRQVLFVCFTHGLVFVFRTVALCMFCCCRRTFEGVGGQQLLPMQMQGSGQSMYAPPVMQQQLVQPMQPVQNQTVMATQVQVGDALGLNIP